MPSRRATAIAVAHNWSGIRALPLRVSLQPSKRARTSSMPGVSPDLRSVIRFLHADPIGGRMTLPVTTTGFHAGLPKGHVDPTFAVRFTLGFGRRTQLNVFGFVHGASGDESERVRALQEVLESDDEE